MSVPRPESWYGMSASPRIQQYLNDHPNGDLLIAVGYATPAGMAWLARRTSGRRVSLLIGDTRSQWWKKVSESDRAICLAFIRRPDVEIRNWYRTKRSHGGESAAHLKVWAIHNNWSPASALVGSGNLTRKGLDSNVEVMVEAHGRDMRQAWDTARDLWGKAWPCADRLAGYLVGPNSLDYADPSHHRVSAYAKRSSATPRRPSGADHRRKPPPPPPHQATARNTRSAARTGGTKMRSRKRVVLYTISGLIAFSGLTAGWQDGIAAVIWMLFVAGLFFTWARRSRN